MSSFSFFCLFVKKEDVFDFERGKKTCQRQCLIIIAIEFEIALVNTINNKKTLKLRF